MDGQAAGRVLPTGRSGEILAAQGLAADGPERELWNFQVAGKGRGAVAHKPTDVT